MASTQNFKNHAIFVPAYHYVALPGSLLILIGSLVNLFGASGEGLYSASLITAIAVVLMITTLYARVFALRAQDRAIRSEENLRHFVLTGKLMDSNITMRQVIGLRFASDDEYLALAERAVKENMAEKEIKQAVTNWRADNDRL